MPKNAWKPIPLKKTTMEPAGKTKEEKRQKELERKRQQKERRETRRESETSTAATAVAVDDISPTAIPKPLPPSSTFTAVGSDIPSRITTSAPSKPDPSYMEARSAHVVPATRSATNPSASDTTTFAIPSIPSWIFDSLAESFDDRERAFAAVNREEGILADLLTLALEVGWAVGWQTGRTEGPLAGQEDDTHEKRIPVHGAAPVAPTVVREFTDTEVQTDTAAVIVLSQELPPSTFPPETVITPLALPVLLPRDLSSLQTGSTRPFGTLQRRLARSRRSIRHGQKNSLAHLTRPIITRRHPHGISNSKPVTTTPISIPPPRPVHNRTLNWDHDPLLSDLSRALGALGWIRRVG
ncbi:hypothetical protein C8R43DRAFT_94066 [Mycena crocata]|nr:hypothetical protein C8R43DRAFT_94066 [Mycena crocata]